MFLIQLFYAKLKNVFLNRPYWTEIHSARYFIKQTWCAISDDVADILLSTLVKCIEEELELLRRLATEH